MAKKRCSCNIWPDIVLNYAPNALILCTKYCEDLHVVLQKDGTVNVCRSYRSISLHHKSFRLNKDKHGGKGLV